MPESKDYIVEITHRVKVTTGHGEDAAIRFAQTAIDTGARVGYEHTGSTGYTDKPEVWVAVVRRA